jgi:hypothetical protein
MGRWEEMSIEDRMIEGRDHQISHLLTVIDRLRVNLGAGGWPRI